LVPALLRLAQAIDRLQRPVPLLPQRARASPLSSAPVRRATSSSRSASAGLLRAAPARAGTPAGHQGPPARSPPLRWLASGDAAPVATQLSRPISAPAGRPCRRTAAGAANAKRNPRRREHLFEQLQRGARPGGPSTAISSAATPSPSSAAISRATSSSSARRSPPPSEQGARRRRAPGGAAPGSNSDRSRWLSALRGGRRVVRGRRAGSERCARAASGASAMERRGATRERGCGRASYASEHDDRPRRRSRRASRSPSSLERRQVVKAVERHRGGGSTAMAVRAAQSRGTQRTLRLGRAAAVGCSSERYAGEQATELGALLRRCRRPPAPALEAPGSAAPGSPGGPANSANSSPSARDEAAAQPDRRPPSRRRHANLDRRAPLQQPVARDQPPSTGSATPAPHGDLVEPARQSARTRTPHRDSVRPRARAGSTRPVRAAVGTTSKGSDPWASSRRTPSRTSLGLARVGGARDQRGSACRSHPWRKASDIGGAAARRILAPLRQRLAAVALALGGLSRPLGGVVAGRWAAARRRCAA